MRWLWGTGPPDVVAVRHLRGPTKPWTWGPWGTRGYPSHVTRSEMCDHGAIGYPPRHPVPASRTSHQYSLPPPAPLVTLHSPVPPSAALNAPPRHSPNHQDCACLSPLQYPPHPPHTPPGTLNTATHPGSAHPHPCAAGDAWLKTETTPSGAWDGGWGATHLDRNTRCKCGRASKSSSSSIELRRTFNSKRKAKRGHQTNVGLEATGRDTGAQARHKHRGNACDGGGGAVQLVAGGVRRAVFVDCVLRNTARIPFLHRGQGVGGLHRQRGYGPQRAYLQHDEGRA